ncbi:MAG TPA: hypothetical protein DCQ32_10660 [Cyanobacteria bacterium UBA8156]|nr:hypothetical protein [Cyanobacteria bacterium UBA8156]
MPPTVPAVKFAGRPGLEYGGGYPKLNPRCEIRWPAKATGKSSDVPNISEKTVKNHLIHIFRELHVKSRSELMARMRSSIAYTGNASTQGTTP